MTEYVCFGGIVFVVCVAKANMSRVCQGSTLAHQHTHYHTHHTQVLDVKLPFDEQQLLRDNEPYLLRALNISSLAVRSASDAAAAAAAGADVAAAYPATPVVVFSAGAPGAAAAAAKEPALTTA